MSKKPDMGVMSKVYIVLAIRDYPLSQKVNPVKVFSERSKANKYAKDLESKARYNWYKVISRDFEA